jgi:hypothetical protein
MMGGNTNVHLAKTLIISSCNQTVRASASALVKLRYSSASSQVPRKTLRAEASLCGVEFSFSQTRLNAAALLAGELNEADELADGNGLASVAMLEMSAPKFVAIDIMAAAYEGRKRCRVSGELKDGILSLGFMSFPQTKVRIEVFK